MVIGIDPGSRHTGWAVVEIEGGGCCLLEAGRLSFPGSEPLSRRLAGLSHDLNGILNQWEPEAAAIESAFVGRSSKSLIVLAQARGAILALFGNRDIEVREYTPAEVKTAVAGNGRADKQQVARMVEILLSLEAATRPSDQTDAMAVAVCFAKRLKMDRLEALHGYRKPL